MLRISYTDYNGRKGTILDWRVGDIEKPDFDIALTVDWVSASGHEREYILGRYGSSICQPYTQNQSSQFSRKFSLAILADEKLNIYPDVMTWFGDMAKFIVANL